MKRSIGLHPVAASGSHGGKYNRRMGSIVLKRDIIPPWRVAPVSRPAQWQSKRAAMSVPQGISLTTQWRHPCVRISTGRHLQLMVSSATARTSQAADDQAAGVEPAWSIRLRRIGRTLFSKRLNLAGSILSLPPQQRSFSAGNKAATRPAVTPAQCCNSRRCNMPALHANLRLNDSVPDLNQLWSQQASVFGRSRPSPAEFL